MKAQWVSFEQQRRSGSARGCVAERASHRNQRSLGPPGAEISALGGASTRRQSPRPSSSTFRKGLSVLHLGTSRSGDLATS